MKLYLAILKGLWVFGLLAWGYVAAIILDPNTSSSQTWPISYYIFIPTNVVGIVGFVVAFPAFILYEWKKQCA